MKERLKIFVDCHIFDESYEGTRTYITGLYQELVKDKSKEFFFAAKNIKQLEEIFGKKENVNYLQLKSENKFYRLLIDIPRLIKENNIDFAHFQYIVPPIKNCKYINTIHDLIFLEYPNYFPLTYRIKNKFLFWYSAKRSDIILTVSNYSKRQIQEKFGHKNVVITPNAVNDVFFEKYDKNLVQLKVKDKYKIENYFIYVSRWEPRKNHHFLLEVFVENKYYEDFYLIFVGRRDLENKEFDNLFKSLEKNIQEKIIFQEKINFEELQLLIRGARISIYPSIAEGFGIPPLEAAAAGITSLYSDATAMKDFDFLENCNFNPFDKIDLNNKIASKLKQSQSIDYSEIIKERYNWKHSALKLIEELNKN